MPMLFGRDYTARELARRTGHLRQLLGVELLEHRDGPERGVRVLRFRTGGGLAFDVLLDRAMDVAGLDFRGVPVGWHGPGGFRSPWLHEVDGEAGLGFLRSFSGLVNTCGLDHIMGPCEEDAAHYSYPYRKRIAHPIHGRVSYTPARLLGYGLRWQGDAGTLFAEGEVAQATMFGENLVLHRRIEADVGGTGLRIQDRVTSHGFHPTPHALLYHVNLGFPVVDDRTRLIAPLRRTRHHVHDPEATTIGPIEQAPPQVGFVEQVYEHELVPDAEGTAFAALVNPDFAWPGGERGLGFVLDYGAASLPAFYQWQNLQEGNYVVGLEPASQLAGSREDWKRRGELRWLGHGEHVDYRLAMTPIAGLDAIAALEARARRALAG